MVNVTLDDVKNIFDFFFLQIKRWRWWFSYSSEHGPVAFLGNQVRADSSKSLSISLSFFLSFFLSFPLSIFPSLYLFLPHSIFLSIYLSSSLSFNISSSLSLSLFQSYTLCRSFLNSLSVFFPSLRVLISLSKSIDDHRSVSPIFHPFWLWGLFINDVISYYVN